MKKIKSFIVITVCFLTLGIMPNVASQAHAHSSGISDFNEEYDILYADIVDRHEQGLITMDEAEEKLFELSRSRIIAGTDVNGQEIAPMALNISGSVRWERVLGEASELLRGVKVQLYHRDATGPNNYIATTYTDTNGNYSFNMGFPWIFNYHTFIRVFAEGKTFRVFFYSF